MLRRQSGRECYQCVGVVVTLCQKPRRLKTIKPDAQALFGAAARKFAAIFLVPLFAYAQEVQNVEIKIQQ